MILGVPTPTICYGVVTQKKVGNVKYYGIQGKDMFGQDTTVYNFQQYVKPYLFREASIQIYNEEFTPAYEANGYVSKVEAAGATYHIGKKNVVREINEALAPFLGKEVHLEVDSATTAQQKTIHAFLTLDQQEHIDVSFSQPSPVVEKYPLASIMERMNVLDTPVYMRFPHDKINVGVFAAGFIQKDGDVIAATNVLKSNTGIIGTFTTHSPIETPIRQILQGYELISAQMRTTIVFEYIPEQAPTKN